MSWVEENQAWLAPYLNGLVEAIGLRDWEIILSFDPPREDGVAGSCEVTYGRKMACIRLAEPQDPARLRQTIVHELLHCHYEPMLWSLNNAQALMGQSTWEVYEGAFTDSLEVSLDGIATVVADFMPLPSAWLDSERSETAHV